MIEVVVGAGDTPQAQSPGEFLRERRLRLSPALTMLGGRERAEHHVGLPIAPEEVAEAAGLSGRLYRMLEAGGTFALPRRRLARLADVLQIGETDRATLMIGNVPILAPAAPPRTAEEARLWTSTWMKRLWAATTPLEAFAIATDAIAERFRSAPAVLSTVRAQDGTWDYPTFLGRSKTIARFSEFDVALVEKLGADAMDEFRSFPQLAQPGDCCTTEALATMSIAQEMDSIWHEYRFEDWSYLQARVRSRSGYVGGLVVAHSVRVAYSEEERAAIGALAAITSLALS